jgi:hypothetical protein
MSNGKQNAQQNAKHKALQASRTKDKDKDKGKWKYGFFGGHLQCAMACCRQLAMGAVRRTAQTQDIKCVFGSVALEK